MKKEEFIRRRGEAAYEKQLERNRQWGLDNREQANERARKWRSDNQEKARENERNWRLANPDKVREKTRRRNKECATKGGKFYLKTLEYRNTGIQGERNRIRGNHAYKWRPYKQIIAPESHCHHEWIFGTSRYQGVALVEADQHRQGIIDVIQILEGTITVLTEAELKVK